MGYREFRRSLQRKFPHSVAVPANFSRESLVAKFQYPNLLTETEFESSEAWFDGAIARADVSKSAKSWMHGLAEIAVLDREAYLALARFGIYDGADRRELEAEPLVIVEAGNLVSRLTTRRTAGD